MKLTKVHIQNFKNLKNFILDIKGQMNFEFLAKNAFGKTSIADAIFWVLTGKLLNGSSDIMSIKPKDNSSALVSVELLFDTGTSIMKTYEENWVKTRGTKEKHLEGHTTSCFVNGINIPVTKFNDSLMDQFKIKFDGKWNGNIFQLLLDPLLFGMKEEWQNRRKLVIDLVGDVTDEDVFNVNSKLLSLEKYLNQANGKFEDVKKILNKNIKKYTEEETKLNAQIEILSREQTVTADEYKSTTQKINEIEANIQALNNKKYQEQKDIIAERKTEIANLKTELSEIKQKDQEKYQKSIEKQQIELQQLHIAKMKTQKELSELNNRINSLNNQKSNLIHERKNIFQDVENNEVQMQSLRNKWAVVDGSSFVATDSLICPQCGHDLHSDLAEQKRKEFNLNKTEELETIKSEGIKLKATNEELFNFIEILKKNEEELQNQIDEFTPQINSFNAKIIELNNKELSLNNSTPVYKKSNDVLNLEHKIHELENKPYAAVEDEQNIEIEINKLQQEKLNLQQTIDNYNAEQMNIKTAERLTNELDNVLTLIAAFESLQMMLTDFIKTKLDILNERVESVFGDIKFQLVESNLKEGSWNEVCYVMDGEVPYHNTNSAQKIRIGIAVCEAIKKKLTIQGLFYIIDNGEQITDRDFSQLTNDQTISFIAYDVDPKTTTEPEPVNLFSIEGE